MNGEGTASHIPADAIFESEIGALTVYRTFSEPVCGGDLNRIRAHWEELQLLTQVEMPATDLVLVDFTSQYDLLPELCGKPYSVGGCAFYWGAYSTTRSALHELTHVVMTHVTKAVPPVLLREGLAEALGGEGVSLYGDDLSIDIEELLNDSSNSHLEEYRGKAHHIVAWLIWYHGLDVTLSVYVAEDDLGTPDSFARAFDYSGISAMQSDYIQTAALEYPPWRDYTVLQDIAEFAAGVDLTPSCDSDTSAMIPNGLRTSVAFEISAPSRYALEYSGLTPSEFEPKRVVTAPRFQPLPLDYDPVDNWGDSICFNEAGLYRISFDRSDDDTFPVFVRMEPSGSIADCP